MAHRPHIIAHAVSHGPGRHRVGGRQVIEHHAGGKRPAGLAQCHRREILSVVSDIGVGNKAFRRIEGKQRIPRRVIGGDGRLVVLLPGGHRQFAAAVQRGGNKRLRIVGALLIDEALLVQHVQFRAAHVVSHGPIPCRAQRRRLHFHRG
ncbi:hypothetical protein SDC9_106694 [bioreactor metagenome]|uniref:Uncharacterized protein n=1 Tax=bioreactor metagenome TaxID=1076179 RepID=A0A645B477_9ZZZZ